MVIILTLSIVGHFTLSHFFGKACSPIFLGKVTDIIPGYSVGLMPKCILVVDIGVSISNLCMDRLRQTL